MASSCAFRPLDLGGLHYESALLNAPTVKQTTRNACPAIRCTSHHHDSTSSGEDITISDSIFRDRFRKRGAFIGSFATAFAAFFPTLVSNPDPAFAVLRAAPPGFRVFTDRLDGYSFFFPESWVQVRGAGADVFFRDATNLDENLTMNISSPSSSRFKTVRDLGSPEDAAAKILKTFIVEFMSTRLGVRREANILGSSSRVADDGLEYYDIKVNVKSYANNNQLAIMPDERITVIEWDRNYIVTLGVSNNRLYELRLQAPRRIFEADLSDLDQIVDSFRVITLNA